MSKRQELKETVEELELIDAEIDLRKKELERAQCVPYDRELMRYCTLRIRHLEPKRERLLSAKASLERLVEWLTPKAHET